MSKFGRFSMIVGMNNKCGIGRGNKIPWHNKEDLLYFKSKTTGTNKRLIVGRTTFDGLPKVVQSRISVILSKTMSPTEGDVKPKVVASLSEALKVPLDCDEENIIIGGSQIYKEAIENYSYLCDKIFVTHIDNDENCDTFFPYELAKKISTNSNKIFGETCEFETLNVNIKHPEDQYLDALRTIMNEGNDSIDRTGVGCRSIFGLQFKFDMRQGFPLITTKRTLIDKIIPELLFFISGSTDNQKLVDQNVNFWSANTSAEYLTKYNLPWKEGDMGPNYGFQWRHAGAKYIDCKTDYTGQGIDQLQNAIDMIKKDPFSRRIIVDSWDVSTIENMALPPCHCSFQFYVAAENGKPKYLDLSMTQRSADMFLGVPFNIPSYAILLHMVAHLTGLIPRYFVHHIKHAHIYHNHFEQVERQLKRTPWPQPRFRINGQHSNIDDFKQEHLVLEDYHSWRGILAPMAV